LPDLPFRGLASIYEDHRSGTEHFDGDIAYNFLICQHGNIYQGRGYERGEANAPAMCPGNLTMYAQEGSTIDPSVAWTGLAAGYETCLQYGHTGWDTVLSLIQGLQYELGISPTVPKFRS